MFYLFYKLGKINTEHNLDNNGVILKANKNLSIALEKAEARCTDAEKKIERLNHYQKIVKTCSNFECKVFFLFFFQFNSYKIFARCV